MCRSIFPKRRRSRQRESRLAPENFADVFRLSCRDDLDYCEHATSSQISKRTARHWNFRIVEIDVLLWSQHVQAWIDVFDVISEIGGPLHCVSLRLETEKRIVCPKRNEVDFIYAKADELFRLTSLDRRSALAEVVKLRFAEFTISMAGALIEHFMQLRDTTHLPKVVLITKSTFYEVTEKFKETYWPGTESPMQVNRANGAVEYAPIFHPFTGHQLQLLNIRGGPTFDDALSCREIHRLIETSAVGKTLLLLCYELMLCNGCRPCASM
ncbi:hypothetical protein AAVH_29867 [Aphelenchoides avenae]|nr:hypothetical protein AAVH_29867 [Aphelenchus avenae]